ncbi:MAG: tripartite tricarboxylate transporter permease [Thermodesulfobacteriota bacterium]|nr:tripartite tricarboxylate transporter permease [Thermodesulfobacteriota bacterium]
MLFTKRPEQVYTIFAGMLLANLLMILVGLVVARFFANLMRVPKTIMGAFIIVFCFLGAFALRNDMSDVWLMAFFGILGFFMRRYELPIPPMILGIILGPLAEGNFMVTLIGAQNDFTVFFRRPVSACLIIISIGLLLMPALRKLKEKRKEFSESK